MSGCIRIEGDALSHHSLASVNRELALGLAKLGWTVQLRQRNDLDQIDCRDDPRVELLYEMLANQGKPDLILRHAFPPDFSIPEERCPLVFMQPWEFGSTPRIWRYGWARIADKILTYTTYNQKMYEDDRVPVPVETIPIGIDDRYFQPQEPMELDDAPGIRILYVGGAIYRKGVDLLLDAVDEAFADEDITLIFKDHPFYERDVSTRIEQCRAHVKYMRHYISPKNMPSLYAACDVFAFPTRGEGFGLPLLEAMSRRLVCVGPDHTGCGDFFDVHKGIVLASEKRVIPNVGLDCISEPFIYEPRDVAKALEQAVYDGVSEKVLDNAREEAEAHRWDKLIPHYDKSLRELLGSIPAATREPEGKRRIALVPGLANSGQIEEAAKIEQDNTQLWSMAANQKIAEGNFRRGKSILDQACRLDPENEVLRHNRALITWQLAEGKVSKEEHEKIVDDLIYCYEKDPSPHIAESITSIGLVTRDQQRRYAKLVGEKPTRKSLSVVMIVRNEEDNLKRSLGSVLSIADEICVVDTGSTDGTVELLRGMGCKVSERGDLYDHKLGKLKSFAEARNASLDMATSDMIMWIDADDEVPPDTATIIRKCIDDGLQALSLPVLCPQLEPNGRETQNIVRHYRVFPNDDRVRFVGKIHEQIAPSIVEAGYDIVMLDAPIMHHGYLVAKNLQSKYERNLAFLLEEDDGGDWVGFNLMTTYLLMGNFEKAIEIGEARIKDLPYDQAHAGKYISTLAACHIAIGNLDKGEEYCRLGIEHKLNLVEQYFNLGGVHMARANVDQENREEHWTAAKKWMLKALDAPISCKGGAIDSDSGFIKPLEALIQLSTVRGDYESVREYILQILSRRYDLRLHHHLIDVYRHLGDEAAAQRHDIYFRSQAEDDIQSRTSKAFELLEGGSIEDGLVALRSICEDVPGNAQAITNLALGHNRIGNHRQALEIMDSVFPVGPTLHGLYCIANSSRYVEDYKTAVAAAEAGLKVNPTDPSFHYEMALSSLKYGRPDLCLQELELSSMLGKTTPESLTTAAICHLKLGTISEALEMARRSVETDRREQVNVRLVYDALVQPI